MIEDELEGRIRRGEKIFDRSLEMVEDEGGYGRSYYVGDCGCVDLLTYNAKDREYVLVDAVAGEADERHLILLWQKVQAFALKQKRGSKVSGVLVCGSATSSLRGRIKQVEGWQVEVYKCTLELGRMKG